MHVMLLVSPCFNGYSNTRIDATLLVYSTAVILGLMYIPSSYRDKDGRTDNVLLVSP